MALVANKLMKYVLGAFGLIRMNKENNKNKNNHRMNSALRAINNDW